MIQYDCARCGLNLTLCQCDWRTYMSDPPPVAPVAGERKEGKGTRPALSENIQKTKCYQRVIELMYGDEGNRTVKELRDQLIAEFGADTVKEVLNSEG